MRFQNIFVSNFSIKVSNGQLLPSTARDGFADSMKSSLGSTFGFSLLSPESAVPGFADLVLYNLGIQTSQQSLLHCSSSQSLSTANDMLVYNDARQAGSPATYLGLRDCEKIYLGLKPSLFDNAANGIPDYLKIRCGINTLNKNAAYLSTASDGVTDIEKCKRNIPIDENFYTQPNQLFAYNYSSQLNTDGSIDITISNIPILDGGLNNFIAFYVTESSQSGTGTSLYTAFSVLKAGYASKTIQAPYWATSAGQYFNQEIVVTP